MTIKRPLRLYDNTRLSDYKRCPRYFFFRHCQGWVLDGPAKAALVFGGAWHAAMDRLWECVAARQTRDDVISAAFGAFITYWIKEGMAPPQEIDLNLSNELMPRTPARALEMLEAYYDARQRFILDVEILEIERPFAVPLSASDPSLFYIGRIDKIVRADSKSIRGIEHKTTTAMRLNHRKEQHIAPMFMESFSPNSQVDGYLYALHILFPEPNIDVWVDAALVHKLGEDFAFIPVERQMQMLDMWLWETHHWVAQIEENKARLEKASEADRFLAAFPKNTNSCFDFNTQCVFLSLCKARSNPLTWPEAPNGYKVDHWDPLSHIGTPKELT